MAYPVRHPRRSSRGGVVLPETLAAASRQNPLPVRTVLAFRCLRMRTAIPGDEGDQGRGLGYGRIAGTPEGVRRTACSAPSVEGERGTGEDPALVVE